VVELLLGTLMGIAVAFWVVLAAISVPVVAYRLRKRRKLPLPKKQK